MKRFLEENWFSFLFRVTGYHFPGMAYSVLTIGGITALMVYIYDHYENFQLLLPSSFQTVVGLVIGLLLVFRTNTAYDRWWEGRKQLGTLLNISRHLAMKLRAWLGPAHPALPRLAALIYAYTLSLRDHLRGIAAEDTPAQVPADLRPHWQLASHRPNYMLNCISLELHALHQQGDLNGHQMLVLDEAMLTYAHLQGACERIRNTPIPLGYALHLKRILLIYILTLPIQFIRDLHWWAVPMAMLVFYIMVGIELIGEEIENPFGTDINDLPIDVICERVHTNVAEIIAIRQDFSLPPDLTK